MGLFPCTADFCVPASAQMPEYWRTVALLEFVYSHFTAQLRVTFGDPPLRLKAESLRLLDFMKAGHGLIFSRFLWSPFCVLALGIES